GWPSLGYATSPSEANTPIRISFVVRNAPGILRNRVVTGGDSTAACARDSSVASTCAYRLRCTVKYAPTETSATAAATQIVASNATRVRNDNRRPPRASPFSPSAEPATRGVLTAVSPA